MVPVVSSEWCNILTFSSRDAPPQFYRTVDQWTYMAGSEMDVLLSSTAPLMINTSLELAPWSCREAPRPNAG